MNDNVHALPGFSVPNTEPVPEVIAILEEALASAKSGKLQGVAVVAVERNPDAFDVAYHAVTGRHTLAAGALALAWQIGAQISTDDD